MSSAPLAVFLDRFIPGLLDRHDVPGAVVALVEGPTVRHLAGYGLSDLEQELPPDPGRTCFRIASLTKLFTATAAMQLHERGQLDLHRPLASYLQGTGIPFAALGEITAAHLLTHTPGYEERLLGVSYHLLSEQLGLRRYLASRLPARIFAPGDVVAYSNHGMALLGLLIEVLSEHEFAEYIHDQILTPLHMRQSTFHLDQVGSALSPAYERRKKSLIRLPIDDYTHIPPAGGLLATAADMARFAGMHLNGGELDGKRVLAGATLAAMQQRQHADHPALPGVGYGWFESLDGEIRSLSHTGGARGFSSLLQIYPDEGVGVFFAANAFAESLFGELAANLNRQLVRRPKAKPSPEKSPLTLPAQAFEGDYRSTRLARTSIEKLLSLRGQLRIRRGSEGELSLVYFGGAERPLGLLDDSPPLFQIGDGPGRVGFRLDEKGAAKFLVLPTSGMTATYERAPWHETLRVQAVFAASLLAGHLIAFVAAASVTTLPGGVRLLQVLIGLSLLLFLGLMGWQLRDAAEDFWRFAYGLSAGLRWTLRIPMLIAALSFVLTGWLITHWLATRSSLPGMLPGVWLVLTDLATVAYFRNWRLLRFKH